MSAFGLVVTAALSSTLATILLSKDVALAEGIAGFALLIGLQFGVTWLSTRSNSVSRLVKAEPTLLVYRGNILESALRRLRVVEAEILQAVRSHGHGALTSVEAVVLETDGNFSVVEGVGGDQSALTNLNGWRHLAGR